MVSTYSNLTWYSGLIGKTFEVDNFDEKGNARIKNGNASNSCWIAKEDYKFHGNNY